MLVRYKRDNTVNHIQQTLCLRHSALHWHVHHQTMRDRIIYRTWLLKMVQGTHVDIIPELDRHNKPSTNNVQAPYQAIHN
jgi:hypothetical protein